MENLLEQDIDAKYSPNREALRHSIERNLRYSLAYFLATDMAVYYLVFPPLDEIPYLELVIGKTRQLILNIGLAIGISALVFLLMLSS